MALETVDWIRWILTFIFMIFHCIVTYFIFCQRRQRMNQIYQSHFFLLYLMISVADIGTLINNFLISKFVIIDAWKPWFFDHPMYNTIFWLCSGYLIYFQSILHTAIAANRASVAFNLPRNSFATKFGRKSIWFLPILSLAILAVRFTGHTRYFYNESGALVGTYVEPLAKSYHAIAGPTVLFSTSLISFFLTASTIIRYRILIARHQLLSISMKHDIILCGQAVITFGCELSLVAYYAMIIVASSNNLIDFQAFAFRFFHYATDISSLCNPIALLGACKFVRKDFLLFLFHKKAKPFIVSTVQPNQ